MKKIRIGNDIVIKWRVTINGEEVNLEGLDLSLYISTTYQPRREIAFTVAGNEITATYKGTAQKVTGVYRLTLYRNEGENSQSILDACDAFELVSCSCLTVDAAFGGAEVELPVADLGVGVPGLSAYEIAVSEGFEGTQEEWLASLSAASEAAAAECREFTDKAKIAEKDRQDKEALRVTAEDERAANERTRGIEEQNRVSAESLRVSAEVSRKTAEEAREADEQQRSTAEVGRSSAEELRKSNEQSRISEETTRSNNEAARIAAETKRANAETTRKNNEDTRQEAERGRVTAETARQSAEATRATAERNRATAEQQRVTNETARRNAESSRVTNETARQTAETARQEAEQGRATAEQQRADAEAARAEEFAGFEGKIAAKEDAANKVTSIGADANNTTFPTTRAVLNSIAEVKNIEVTPEMLSESTKQYINASGGGTITNLADDEDLTSVGNVLKLADKDYSPTSYSGMGRVYLRKNMVDGKNILTQEMMTKENTIYIIQYDYDLNGATINVPANCTLDFQGGSLGNGTIVGQATKISCRETDIFRSILLVGKWIGAVSDLWFAYRLDSYAHFNIVSSLFKFEQIDIYRQYYYLEKWLAINISNSNVSVYGHGVNIVLPANKGETAEGYAGYHEYKISALFVTDAQEPDTLCVTDVNIVDNQNVISGWGENVDAEKIIRLNIFTASYKNINFDNVSYDGTGELLHIWTSKQCKKISINNCRVTTSEFAYEIGTVGEGKLEKVEFNNCVIIGRINAPWVGHVSLVGNTIPEVIFNNFEIYSAVIGNLETSAVQSLTITSCRFTNHWVSTEPKEVMGVLNIHNSTFIQTKVVESKPNSYKFYAKRLNITNNTIISEYGLIEQLERAEEIFFCNNTVVYKGESPSGYMTVLSFAAGNDRVYFIGNKFYNSTQPQNTYRPYLSLPSKYMVNKDNAYDNWNISTGTKNMYSTMWTFFTGTSITQTNGLAMEGQTIVPEIEQRDADCYTVEMMCVIKHLDTAEATLGAFTIGEQTITLGCSYNTLNIKVGGNIVARNSVLNCLVSKGIHQDIQFTTVIYKEGDNTSVLVSINGNEVIYAKTDIPWVLPSITINTTDMLPLRAYRCYMGGIIKEGIESSNTPYENTRIGVPLSGIVLESTKAKRPNTGRLKGQSWFDTTLGKPIWWTGSAWVDATGQEV